MEKKDNIDITDNTGYSSNIADTSEENMKLHLLCKQNKMLMKKLQEAQDLNQNLLRICRERANSQRGVSPKKKHPGYLVLRSSQWKQKFQKEISLEDWKAKNKNKNINLKLYRRYENYVIDTWQTILETPYDASLPLSQIEDEIWRDLKTKGILYSMGIQQRCAVTDNGKPRTWKDKDGKALCGIYKWIFEADYRNGYWTLRLFHTLPITVPMDLRKKSE